LQHSSVGSVLACCTADPSSNPSSALQGVFPTEGGGGTGI
jgi:hypothetical protein